MGLNLESWSHVAQILSLFLGVITLIFTILTSRLFGPAAQIPLLNKLRPYLPYVITATIAFLLGTFVPGSMVSYQPEEWTTNLTDGERVAYVTVLTVKHPADVQGDIWVLTRQDNLKYYPAPRGLDISKCQVDPPSSLGNEVEVPIYFGNEKDYNRPFSVLVVVTDKSASQFLTNTLVDWCRNDYYPGLQVLPQGLVIKRQIDVRRSGIT